MKVYIVNQVCEDEYGCTGIEAVFSTREQAQAFADAHQYQWHAWFMKESETRDALTVKEWVVDEPNEFERLI